MIQTATAKDITLSPAHYKLRPMSSPGTVKIDASFKFEGGKEFYETRKAWAKVRIKKDDKLGDHYVDVLMGSKGKDPHIHLGANGDGTLRFMEDRGKLSSLRRRVVDSKRGVLEDKSAMLKPETGENTFEFTVLVDEPTRTIKVIFKDATLK